MIGWPVNKSEINDVWNIKLFWCWRQNIPALSANTMSADALAPKVASASAEMVLVV